MPYTIEYFHPRVRAEIEDWPVGILAYYARIVELLVEFGPNLRMPHSRALGGGLFELRPRGLEYWARVVLLHLRPTSDHIARILEEDKSNSAT